MSPALIFKAALRKEVRTLCRDRAQLATLVILIVSGIFGAVTTGWAVEQDRRAAQERRDALKQLTRSLVTNNASAPLELEPEPPDPPPEMPLWMVRWILLGSAAALALYASFFAIPLGLAAFAGEREQGTLEIILASPVSDRLLYLCKAASVMVIAALSGYVLLLLGVIYLLLLPPSPELVRGEALGVSLLVALPLPLVFSALQVGSAVLCSASARTQKGAGQLYGSVITVVSLGVPLLFYVAMHTGLEAPLRRLGGWWVEQGFPLQVGLLYLVLGVVAGIPLLMGQQLFRRERMLL